MLKVCFIVPTFRSRSYFNESLAELVRAVNPLRSEFEVSVLVVLNGSGDEDERAVRAAMEQWDVPSELLVSSTAGQNNATNTGVQYARSRGVDIVHLVDDDQSYGPDALLINVTTLVAMRNKLGILGLVGSSYVATREKGDGFTSWIAALSFEPGEERPKFCMGGSLCTWASEFPELPTDDTGIANDAYVCNIFYSRFRELYRATGFMPIIKPRESLTYIRVASRWNEYKRQQLRIRFGVLSAYNEFGDIAQELREYFNWKFHCDASLGPRTGLVGLLRWWIFLLLRRRINAAAVRRIAAGTKGIEWGVATSTKRPIAKAVDSLQGSIGG